jgi:hypothetical protein
MSSLNWASFPLLYSLNTFLSDQSTLGQLLKALVGFNSSPSLTQVIGYLVYFAL